MCIELVMPFNHFIPCHPLLLLPSTFPSIKVFSNELVLRIRWPKYWSFSFSISPSNGYPEFIPFGIDWFDLSRVFSNNTVQKHQFFDTQPFSIVQLSHPYMISGKAIASAIGTFPG